MKLENLKSELVSILVNNTPVAYIILDDKFRIHYINDYFLKLRDLDLKATLGEKCYNISNGGVPCSMCAVAQAFMTGKKAFISRKDILPDNSVRFIDDYAMPLQKNNNDKNNYVLEIMVNRTQEMAAREQRDADYDEILSIFSKLIEAKDNYTALHSNSVRDIAYKLAKAMGLSAREIFDISIAASLHDIGKVSIPDAIINKPGKLTDEEFKIIKKHSVSSYDMLNELSSFDNIKDIVRHHHERFDGKGYPDKLAGDQISFGGRVIAIADTYDAITSTRSYRKALTHEYALEEIARGAGTQFDPDIVKIFLTMDFSKEEINFQKLENKNCPVERLLEKQKVITESKDIREDDFKKMVDQDYLLNQILDNTPCGYVLMDTNRKVIFASKYFLEYMGLSKKEVIGKICYEAAGIGVLPCHNCAVERSLESGKAEYMRQEQDTKNGRKIFDLFGMPLKDENSKTRYVIEIIIDRTEEIKLEQMREQDFKILIDRLSNILKEQHSDASSRNLSSEILLLYERLNNLLEKK